MLLKNINAEKDQVIKGQISSYSKFVFFALYFVWLLQIWEFLNPWHFSSFGCWIFILKHKLKGFSFVCELISDVWLYLKLSILSFHWSILTFAERFTVLSYNILADYLATDHQHKLYFHVPRHMLDWKWRKRSILFELRLWSADILCFQVNLQHLWSLKFYLIPLMKMNLCLDAIKIQGRFCQNWHHLHYVNSLLGFFVIWCFG